MAMLPLVLSMGAGGVASIPLDSQQELELLMTIGQQLIGLLFLINMELVWWEAGLLLGYGSCSFASRRSQSIYP